MYDANKAIVAARTCLGTPFVPQGRLPQVGLDCGGLVMLALAAGDKTVGEIAAYSFPPAPDFLIDALARNNLIAIPAIIPGAVLLFRFQNRAQHLALATSPDSMIHAFAPAGQVVETTIGAAWRPRLLGCYYPKD